MFTVKPVRDKNLQEALTQAFACPYHEDSYAFLAGNSDDGETLTSLLGLSQFKMNGEADAVIYNVTASPNFYDEEVIIILVRTVMNFVYRAGIPVIYIAEDACSEEEIKKFGFRRGGDGRYSINLKKFYFSPCHYADSEK